MATPSEFTVNIDYTRLSTMSLTSDHELHGISGHGFTAGHGASSGPCLHISNHLASQQNGQITTIVSLHTHDASVTVPICLVILVGFNY